MRSMLWAVLVVVAVLVTSACGKSSPPRDDGSGQVRLALAEVPADVGCVEITAVGTHTVTRRVAATPGMRSSYLITGLPEGQVQLGALAFDSECTAIIDGQVPSWLSDVVLAVLPRGTPVDIRLELHRNTKAVLTLDFVDQVQVTPLADGGVPNEPPEAGTDAGAAGAGGGGAGGGSMQGCQGPVTPGQPAIGLQTIATSLGSSVTAIVHAGDARLFIAEQSGFVWISKNNVLLPSPFLDLSGVVVFGGEEGLLSLAFSPAFSSDHHFYASYSRRLNGNIQVVVSRFDVSANDPDVADPSSGAVILQVDKDFSNNNGGQLAFGPDGYLYVGTGDGGGAGDPNNNAQSPASLLGKILRIDVSTDPYTIPVTNPLPSSSTSRGEIWALGLRNPWRFSFDRLTGDLFVGDVGQNTREEIDYQAAGVAGGRNYGWKLFEGTSCVDGLCDPTGLVSPIYEYGHNVGGAIIGGYVYRGCQMPGYVGRYIFGDFQSSQSYQVEQQGGVPLLLHALPALTNAGPPTTFGEDVQGELYLGTASGSVGKIVAQ